MTMLRAPVPSPPCQASREMIDTIAFAMHVPCRRHARAMHMPCTCTVPGVEMITVQSYSKNMGLYAERAGVVSFTYVTLPPPGCTPPLAAP